MKVEQFVDGSLRIVTFPWLWALLPACPLAALCWHVTTRMKIGWDSQDWNVVLFLATFTAFAAALCSAVCKRSVFEFDPSRQELICTQRGLWANNRRVIPFHEIKLAMVERSDSESTTYCVELYTAHQGFIVLVDYLSKPAADDLAQDLNSLLQTHGRPLDPRSARGLPATKRLPHSS